MKHLVALVVFASLVATAIRVPAQTSDKVDRSRMQRDLEIMETILNQLFGSSQYGLTGFSSNGARGLYFDGYGVLFQIEFGGHSSFAFRKFMVEESLNEAEALFSELKEKRKLGPPAKATNPGRSVVIVDSTKTAPGNEPEMSVEERIDRLKDLCTQFLGDYADAIGQMQPEDRVTVLFSFRQSVPLFSGNTYTVAQGQPAGLEVTVAKRDIIAYRKGGIDEQTFRERISFTERADSQNKNIDIMTNILSTALNRKYHPDFASETRNRGIYLDGLGALFFLKVDLLNEQQAIPFEHYLDKYMDPDPPKPPGKRNRTQQADRIRDSVDQFKKELVDLVGNYGHTLRTLKPTEYVVIDADFQHSWGFFSDMPQIVLRIQKQDLDKFDRGDLSFAQLQQRAEFVEY